MQAQLYEKPKHHSAVIFYRVMMTSSMIFYGRKERIIKDVYDLKNLTADNPAQQLNCNRLLQYFTKKMSIMEQGIDSEKQKHIIDLELLRQGKKINGQCKCNYHYHATNRKKIFWCSG